MTKSWDVVGNPQNLTCIIITKGNACDSDIHETRQLVLRGYLEGLRVAGGEYLAAARYLAIVLRVLVLLALEDFTWGDLFQRVFSSLQHDERDTLS